MEPEFPTVSVGDPAVAPAESHAPISWPAIFAGAVAALALSFVLLALAGGFGMKLTSPWPGSRPSLDDFTPVLGAFAIVVQVLSCAFGGYLAGRLRTKWSDVHSHEVHFRDTAHGVLVWALSTVAGVVLAASVMAPAAARLAAPAASAALLANDRLASPGPVLAAEDPAVVQARVVREANVTAQISLFMGIGLLLSGFTAAVAAAIGGLRRDEMHATYWSERRRA